MNIIEKLYTIVKDSEIIKETTIVVTVGVIEESPIIES